MKPASVYCIEGEYVTAKQIADRTGLAVNSVWNKLHREGDRFMTWAVLADSAKPRRGNYKPRQCRGWYNTRAQGGG